MDQTKDALYEQIDRLKLFLLEKGYSPHTISYYSACWNSSVREKQSPDQTV